MTDGAAAGESRPRAIAWRSLLLPVAVALVVFVAFAPALHAGFVTWDDDENFLRNLQYRGLSPAHLRWMWTTNLLGHYVPLSWMSLGLDFSLWGMDARGYHFTSLLLHAANAVLLFFVCRRLVVLALGAEARAVDAPAALGALLYAVHPLRAESVVWITERRDVLSSFFVLLAVLAYLRSARNAAFGKWYWAALVALVCALLSKATAVTLPVVLAVVAWYPLRLPRRRIVAELAPMLLLSAAAGIVSLVMLEPGPQLPIAAKLAVSAYGVWFYLLKSVAPIGLAPLYEMPSVIRPLDPPYLLGYLASITLVIGWILCRRRWPGVAAATAAAAIMILPLLGAVQNGVQIAADRYTYQAMQPIAVLLAGLLAFHWRRAAAAGAAIAVAVLAALSARQSTSWKDSETLWKRVITVDPKASLARTALANVLLGEGRLDEAIEEYRQSLAINPSSAEANTNLGIALTRGGRFEEAATAYRGAIQANPRQYEAHNNLGTVLARLGDAEGAIDHYRQAVAIKADFPDAEVNWGNALLRMGRPVEAVAHYARAIAISPRAPGAEYNWGVALAQQGRFVEAATHFRAAVAHDPADASAREALAAAERQARGGR